MAVKTFDDIDDLLREEVVPGGAYDYEFLGALVQSRHAHRFVDMNGVGHIDVFGKSVDATKKIIEKARNNRPPPPPAEVVPASAPVDPFHDVLDDIFFADDAVAIMGSGESSLPVTRHIRDKLRGGNQPKYVRLDTPETYAEFRADQSPEIAELRQKVAELEELIRNHMADGHGGQAIIQGYAEEIATLRNEADLSKKRVPLLMPPFADGKWDCWKEGDLLCASINLPGCDGDLRICTSATPVARHVEEVVGYCHEANASVTEMLGVLPTIACMLGGGQLISQMAASAPSLLARPEAQGRKPFLGKIVPKNRADFATLMMLLQKAQSGDPQAQKEWKALALIPKTALHTAMDRAKKKLVREQGQKS